MRERPEGAALLAVAAQTLREQVLPVLAEDKKYLVLMVLKALSLAELQLSGEDPQLRVERELLEALLHQSFPGDDLRACVEKLERELGHRVRQGAYDDDRAGQLALWKLTLQRVRESAPRYLESEDIE